MREAKQVIFRCESCGKGHVWRRRLAGKKAKCPCGHIMRVPADLPVGVIHDESERPDLDIADVEHMDVAPAPVKAKPRLGWWVLLIVFGGLIGLASAIDVFAHDRLVSLLGVILAAALVLAGLWTRPGADAGTGP